MDEETRRLVEEIVKSVTYLPDWMCYLGDDNEQNGWLTLHIVSSTPDSYNTDRRIRVNHSFLMPPATWNERTWKAWIFERHVDVWRHETGEFLTFDGVREFAPHHGDHEDPYITWHIGDVDDTRVRAGETKEAYVERTAPKISNEDLTQALKEYGQTPEGRAWVKSLDLPPRLPEVYGEDRTDAAPQ